MPDYPFAKDQIEIKNNFDYLLGISMHITGGYKNLLNSAIINLENALVWAPQVSQHNGIKLIPITQVIRDLKPYNADNTTYNIPIPGGKLDFIGNTNVWVPAAGSQHITFVTFNVRPISKLSMWKIASEGSNSVQEASQVFQYKMLDSAIKVSFHPSGYGEGKGIFKSGSGYNTSTYAGDVIVSILIMVTE